ncbi:MAG TPA: hypothetical protein VIO64_10580 [Pseudobacteroides sp.]|uniref:hypothetical protein n=1 Tax=Pseudobacteroides sp. TaxID=1968840 RepID=UPI002F9572B6
MNDENFDSLKRKEPNKKSVMLVVIAAVVVSLLFLGIALTTGPKLLKKESAPVVHIIGNLPYEFTEPELNIDPTHEFVFDAKYDPKKVEGYNPQGNFSHAIAVYCDPGMTVEAKGVLINYDSSDYKFHVKPHYSGVSGSSTTLEVHNFPIKVSGGFIVSTSPCRSLIQIQVQNFKSHWSKNLLCRKNLKNPFFHFQLMNMAQAIFHESLYKTA